MAENPLTQAPPRRPAGSLRRHRRSSSCGGFYYFWYADGPRDPEEAGGQARGAAEADPGARGDREQAAGVPAGGAGARGAPRDAEAHPAPREGDARPDAARAVPRRAVEPPDPQVQPGAPRPRRSSTRRSRSTSTSRARTTTWGPSWTGSAGCPGSSTWATSRSRPRRKPTISNTVAASAVATTYVYQDAAAARTRRASGRRRSEAMRGLDHEARARRRLRPRARRAGPRPGAGAGRRQPRRPTAEAATPGAGEAARPPLDVELETGGYSYNSQGRRDPFVSLQRPVAADRGPKTRKPGMEGFLIQEIALKGDRPDEGRRDRRGPEVRASSRCSWAPTESRIS